MEDKHNLRTIEEEYRYLKAIIEHVGWLKTILSPDIWDKVYYGTLIFLKGGLK